MDVKQMKANASWVGTHFVFGMSLTRKQVN